MDLKNLTDFFTMKDEALVKKYFGGERYKIAENGVYLMAHTDTVHKRLPKKSEIVVENGVWSAPGVGLGADDRVGCFIVHHLMEKYPGCGYLLSPDEETGDKKFMEDVPELPAPKVFLSFDQSGVRNYVNYKYPCREIETFLGELGLERWRGSGSSGKRMAEKYGVPCVNMCIGANRFHCADEYLDTRSMIDLIPMYEALIRFCLRNRLKIYSGGKCRTLAKRGIRRANAGNHRGAIKDFTAALPLARDNAEAADILVERGKAYIGCHEYEMAIADFTSVWEGSILKCYDALSGRALAYLLSDKFELAIADFNAYLEYKNAHPYALCRRGIAYGHLQDYNKAIADFTAALKVNPKDNMAIRWRGNTYLEIEKYDLAIADYTAALKIDPKDTRCLYNRAFAYGEIDEDRKAAADFRKILRIDPKYPDADYIKEILEDISKSKRSKKNAVKEE